MRADERERAGGVVRERIALRSAPHAGRFLAALGGCVAAFHVSAAGPGHPAAGLVSATVVVALLPVALWSALAMHRQGPVPAPLAAALGGVALAVGGALADMLATAWRSPTLELEANPVLRGLLDHGASVPAVYAYGIVVEALRQATICVSWVGFLRHRGVLVGIARACGGSSAGAFAAAGLGLWRRRGGECPGAGLRAYVWAQAVATYLLASSLERWYLAAVWMGLASYRPERVPWVVLVTWALAYGLWLWERHAAGVGEG